MNDSPINPILGTMTFGPQVDLPESKVMVDTFLAAGGIEIDTAYVYNQGDSESYLGEWMKDPGRRTCLIATKVNPRVTGRLDAESIRSQLEVSLQRLGLESVDLLYLHFPDPGTPLESTLAACANLHAEGKFDKLGVSNYPAWEVVHIWHLCRENGWPAPVVYQGLYNPLSRGVEPELFPALRQLGMRFLAYNPLAGGILSGKYTNFEDQSISGRFTFRPNYRDRYWKPSFFKAMQILSDTCRDEGISLLSASFRWMVHHSLLSADLDDGILLGASSSKQLNQNLSALREPGLPSRIVEAFEDAWTQAKAESPAYFRTIG
jgi:aflatoxin B1 aldehyde reductase